MCKFNPKNDARRIDPCMKDLISNLNVLLIDRVRILACCCGHGKYPMTVVIKVDEVIRDLISNEDIPRKKRFYKKDKQGYYYIPETIKI